MGRYGAVSGERTYSVKRGTYCLGVMPLGSPVSLIVSGHVSATSSLPKEWIASRENLLFAKGPRLVE